MTSRASAPLSEDATSDVPRAPVVVPRPSETVEVLVSMVRVLPRESAQDLLRVVQRRLTMLEPAHKRYARLGLLINIVGNGDGVLPPTREYEQERTVEARRGEVWPTASELSTAYGGWVRAVRAAMLLAYGRTSARVSYSNRHRDRAASFTIGEAVNAMLTCRDALGEWPNEREYDEWRVLSRDLARRSGAPAPRYPSLTAWKRLFGSWGAFETAARAAHRDRRA